MKKTNKIKKFFKKDKVRKNGIFLVMLALAVGGVYFYAQPSELSKPLNSTDVLNDISRETLEGYALAPSDDGRSFAVSSSDKSGPRLVSFFIDPGEPEIGEEQLGGVHVIDSEPVTSVVMTIITDNQSVDYELELVEGTELDGHWQGTWVVDDTNDEVYEIPISATSSRGTSEIHATLK